MICVVCCIPDQEPLYDFYDAESNENCPAHEGCGESTGLEQEGSQPVN